MASFRIVPVHDDRIEQETIQNRVQESSALSGSKPREGALPQTLNSYDRGIHYFKYGHEEKETVVDLEGNEQEIVRPERNPIIFLGNGYVAIDAWCSADVEDDILGLIAAILDRKVHYETVEFDEETLRRVIQEADRVEQADFDPETSGKPEKVSGKHKSGLTRTEMWDAYHSDPLEAVRVSLPGKDVEMNVGFKENGIITIHGQDIPGHVSGAVLRYITDEVVSNLAQDSYQQKLGGAGP